MRRRAILGVVVCLSIVACLPRERLNYSCRWSADSGVLPARRTHLIEDVRVAEELGIRHADSVIGPIFNDAYRRARDTCTAASIEEIQRRHGVSHGEIAAVTGVRELWVDSQEGVGASPNPATFPVPFVARRRAYAAVCLGSSEISSSSPSASATRFRVESLRFASGDSRSEICCLLTRTFFARSDCDSPASCRAQRS